MIYQELIEPGILLQSSVSHLYVNLHYRIQYVCKCGFILYEDWPSCTDTALIFIPASCHYHSMYNIKVEGRSYKLLLYYRVDLLPVQSCQKNRGIRFYSLTRDDTVELHSFLHEFISLQMPFSRHLRQSRKSSMRPLNKRQTCWVWNVNIWASSVIHLLILCTHNA